MKITRLLSILSLSIIFLLALSFQNLHAAAGGLDPLDVSISGGQVLTTVLQPDGKIIVGGTFTSVQGVPRNRVARINPDGTLDNNFDPNANNTVESIVVQAGGKIILGGFFTTLQPGGTGPVVTRQRLARLNADGTPDTGFDPSANQEVLSIAEQTDGKIVIVGRFTTLQPNGAAAATIRNQVARLNPDGTPDTGFNPNVVGFGGVYSLAIQADGKILVVGAFSTVGGTSRNNIARLNADGTLDTAFNPNASDSVNSIAIQADGKILVGGNFFSIANYGHNRIARLNSDGTADNSFYPGANNTVYSMAVQADGNILIAGYFTTLSSGGTVTRNRIARLRPDGTVDTGFDPNAGSIVNCVALQADGGILLAGYFTTLQPNGGTAIPRAGFAKLSNDPATQSLTLPNGNQAKWTRGGSSPELSRVSFQLSTDSGTTWTSLGAGTRQAGSTSWRINGLPLPSGGRIRALGVTSDGNGSTGGLIESVADFANLPALPALPEITVFTGAGTTPANERPSNSTALSFPLTAVGESSAAQTFTISNTGLSDLTGLALSVTGTNPADFTLSAPGTTLAPGASTTFTVKFAPSAAGVRGAVVNLSSNDPHENNFIINIQGTATASGNANLAALGTSAGSLAPVFDPATIFYSAEVPNTIKSLTVTPTKAEINASIAVRINGSLYPVASGSASDLLALQAGPNYINVVVTAQNGTTKTYYVTVTRAGAVQGSADPLVADTGPVFAVATQPDGKIILAGGFSSVAGVARNHIARLNADGTLDTSFDPNVDGHVFSVAVQTDGRILIGGEFSTLRPAGAATATSRSHLARLNADGTVDTSFDPHPDAAVYCVALQPDGRILICGEFILLRPDEAVPATLRNHIARLNPDGTPDNGFNPNADSSVSCLAVQPDGKVLLAGFFSSIQSDGAATATPRSRVARLNADGTLDPDFHPNPNGMVNCFLVQPDGKVLLGGQFSSLQPNATAPATTRNGIARVNSDGNPDPGFNPNTNGSVYGMALEVNGRVLIGGDFTSLQPEGAVKATTRQRIARMNPDGTLDMDFDPSADSAVLSLALQADGKVLLGGDFEILRPNGATRGVARSGFARLFNEPATRNLTISGTNRIEWTRGGSSPEVEQVTFEISTNGGTDYTLLGAGNRIDGGWELSGLSLSHGLIRARGRTTSGRSNGSGGFVETITNFDIAATPIAIWRQNYFGSSANTGSGADGSDPDHDGLVNLIEYAFGLNPTVPDTALLPQLQRTGGNLSFIFTPPSGIGGIIYGAEWSNDFSNWNSITDTGSAPQRVFTVTAAGKTALFVRLTVTAP